MYLSITNPEMALRTARKHHRCTMSRLLGGTSVRRWDHGPVPSDHRETIEPGDVYVEDAGDALPFQSGQRYCVPCARAAGLVRGVA